MKTSTVAAVENRFVEREFFKDTEALWQQLEQALSANGSAPLTTVDWNGSCRFSLATADQLFTHELVLAFLNDLRQWAREKIDARHVSTPQVHVYDKRCYRDIAPDAIQVRWHYLYSLTRSDAATIRLLSETDPQKRWLGISLSRLTNLQLRFNQLLVHETRDAYGLVGPKRATNALDGTILLHGYLW